MPPLATPSPQHGRVPIPDGVARPKGSGSALCDRQEVSVPRHEDSTARLSRLRGGVSKRRLRGEEVARPVEIGGFTSGV